MPDTLDQASRPLEIQTPLGDGVVGLRSILVREQLGRMFRIEADLSSHNPNIKFDDIVGHPVVIRLTLPGGTLRFWHGIVARFQFVGQTDRYSHYRAEVVPWLWALTRSSDCRIFQELSVPDIVQKVFRDRGAKDFSVSLSGTYPANEYCVQYRETDFSFVSRLLEREGIAYYFKHTKEKGTLVLADEKAAYEPAEGYAEVLFRPGGGDEPQQEAIKSWIVEHEVQPTQYALNDYNPLRPNESLLRTAQIPRQHGMNDRQMFDYPGMFSAPAESERISRLRLEELHVGSEVVRASGTCLGLGTGNLFKLRDHPRSEQAEQHLVTSLTLQYDAGEFDTAAQQTSRYACEFTAIPSANAFRPARTTPKPIVHGPQPAIVVTPNGEEIHTDEHGRVKVYFYWDREGKADEKSSCWVRVAQQWAGKKWGSFFIPRQGHEVLVEFLEGDPDRPIITGSVYNGANKPPYALPGEKTKSTLKSLSSKGGGGFNEFRIEDKKGSEQIFVHAEKDVEIRVKNDTKEWVGHDRHLVVKRDQVELVENDRHEKVKRDHIEQVERDRHVKIMGKEALAVVGTHSHKVGDDVTEEFEKNQSTKVTKDYYLKAKNITLEAEENITLHVGDSYIAIEKDGIKICTTGEIAIEATKNISVKATQNFKVEATASAEIKGTGGLKLESPATTDLKGSMTTVKGDGMVTVQGGLVKIN